MRTPKDSDNHWLPNNKRDETPAERADRNFVELLQEFRVAQQGVQVLFAFLLTVPFTSSFTNLADYQHWMFATALISAATSTILFVAPVSHHRMLFQRGMKTQLVRVASRLAQAGIVFMLIAMLASVSLVSDVVFGHGIAIVLGSSGLIFAIAIWYTLPALYKRKQTRAKVGSK